PMRKGGRPLATPPFALALGFFGLPLPSWQSIATFGPLSGIAILAGLAAELFVLPALILGITPGSRGPEPQQVSGALPSRGRGVLALLALLGAGAMLHAVATRIAERPQPRPSCRWLAGGHVLPPGSLDPRCPLAAYERVLAVEVGGRSLRPDEVSTLRKALAGGGSLRVRVAHGEDSAWVDVPLLGGPA